MFNCPATARFALNGKILLDKGRGTGYEYVYRVRFQNISNPVVYRRARTTSINKKKSRAAHKTGGVPGVRLHGRREEFWLSARHGDVPGVH